MSLLTICTSKVNTKSLIAQARDYIDTGLWSIDMTGMPLPKRMAYGLLRIIVMTIKEFMEQKASIRASALTYYTLLSIVPVAALAFAISKGFGLENLLKDYINESFSMSDGVADYLITFSSSALQNTKSGLIAGVGVVMLLYSVFKLLDNIEAAFNTMWCVKKPRGLFRKIADYMCIMLFSPILLLTASSATLLIKSSVKVIFTGELTPFQDILLGFLPYLLLWTSFTLLYLVMPNTKVKFIPALVAGIVTGTAFQIVQWVYITFQIGVNNAGAVYGSFAFLPLLLAWLQITWTIVLAGCKIAFSIQNVTDYSLEHGVVEVSQNMRRKMSVLIMHKIVTAFKRRDKIPSGIEIANETGMAKPLFFHLIERLKRARLVAELENGDDKSMERTFIPAVDINDITVTMICTELDKLGDDDKMSYLRNEEFNRIAAATDALMNDGARNADKTPLADI